jgi:dTDP-4-dehydrorhamnose reductase
MRVIVLGATGMFGHKLIQRLTDKYEVAGTVRSPTVGDRLARLFKSVKIYCSVDANNFASVEQAIADWKADVVLNCVGLIKQQQAANDALISIPINSLFPHQLARLNTARGTRLLHFSTDCVFSGRRGNYIEDDLPDPLDLYGRSKLLGEVVAPNTLTLRTSIVGRGLSGHLGLIDWFVSQRGRQVNGYVNALYSGLTTIAAADLVLLLIRAFPKLDKLWHVSGDPISKFDLLQLVNRIYDLGIELVPDKQFKCDRRLDSSRFRKCTGWQPRSWEEMIVEMHSDEATYACLDGVHQ